MSLETYDVPVICFENTKSVTKQLEIVFKCSENLIGAAITLKTECLAVKCKALLLFFLSYGDLPVIDIFNSDFLWFHQHYTSTCL